MFSGLSNYLKKADALFLGAHPPAPLDSPMTILR